MGASRKLTRTRLAEILRRQDPPAFGPAYEPAIKATRKEAPPNCRPATIWSERLQRDIATLSQPERDVVVVVLYADLFFDLHEQRMLPFLSSPHPLAGHPLAAGTALRASRGTLVIADELKYLKFHPIVTGDAQQDGDAETVPGCMIGDFLLFIKDAAGPFCVNLNIKSTRLEFSSPQVGVTVKTDMKRANAKEIARHEIERRMYAEIDIPTHEIATDEMPQMPLQNLRQLVLWQKRKHGLNEAQRELVIDALDEGLDRQLPALEVINALELSHGINPYDQKIVLYQAIFARRLRVDLFQRFFIDKPMMVERVNLVDTFGHWFRRSL